MHLLDLLHWQLVESKDSGKTQGKKNIGLYCTLGILINPDTLPNYLNKLLLNVQTRYPKLKGLPRARPRGAQFKHVV